MTVYLVDTNIVSEARRGPKANAGVKSFFSSAILQNAALYVSAITIGELRHGVEKLRHRGDADQAERLEQWLLQLVEEYADAILAFDGEMAQVWGRLRVPHPKNPIDKQIAATALMHDLILVTRNVADFARTGVRLLNPFE